MKSSTSYQLQILSYHFVSR